MEKMADWYRGLSCLVSMSKAEGCSGVVFEAMATGLPVISTPVGWHAENCMNEIMRAWRPEDQTPENDRKCIEALALQISRLKNDYKAARARGAAARAFAERWPHKRIADQWVPIIDSVLLTTAEK